MCHFWISAGLALLDLAAPAHPAGPEVDRLLVAAPSDALMVVSVASLDDLRKRSESNAWAQLCRDEAVEPFFAHLGAMVERARLEALKEESEQVRTLTDPSAWCGALHGALLGVVAAGAQGAEPSAALFVERAEPVAELDRLVDGLIEVLEADEECAPSTAQHAGVELRLYEQILAPGTTAHPDVLIAFQCAGVEAIVLGDSREAALDLAQGAIERLSGKDASGGLRGSERLSEARAAAGHGHALELLVDVGGMIAAAEREEHAAGAAAADDETARVLDRIGVSRMRWVYAAADLGQGETLDFSLAVHLPAGSLLADFGRLFQPAPRALLTLAPPEALGAGIGSFDVNGLYQLVLRAVQELAPEEYASMRAGIDATKQELGLDFEGQFLGQLSGEFATVTVRIPREEVPAAVTEVMGEKAADVMTQSGAFVIGLKDAGVVESFLDQALQLGDMREMVESAEYQGHWIQTLELPGQSLLWSFADKWLVVGQSPTAVRAVLARLGSTGGASLATDPRYQAALGQHPSASMLSIADARISAEAMLGALGMLSEMLQMALPMESEGDEATEFLAELSQGPTPDPSAAGKYLDGVLVTSVEVRGDALRVHYSAR